MTEFCIISNYSKRSVFWIPSDTNLVVILIYGIAFSPMFKLWNINCLFFCRFMLCLTLWWWNFRWNNHSFRCPHTWQVQDSAFHTESENLKYKELVLRENINNKKTGYHAECCRKFNALGRNAPPKNDDVRSKSGHTRSKSTLASASLSIGVMLEIFIFYTKKDKKHDQEIGNNPRESSIIIQTEKRWFCRQRNTLLWHM